MTDPKFLIAIGVTASSEVVSLLGCCVCILTFLPFLAHSMMYLTHACEEVPFSTLPEGVFKITCFALEAKN